MSDWLGKMASMLEFTINDGEVGSDSAKWDSGDSLRASTMSLGILEAGSDSEDL